MFVWWGPDLINLYNDGYKLIIARKHPQVLGQSEPQVWREICDELGPRAHWAMNRNEGTYDEALLLIMERYCVCAAKTAQGARQRLHHAPRQADRA